MKLETKDIRQSAAKVQLVSLFIRSLTRCQILILQGVAKK
jgi:hypothetical protein